MNKRALKVFTNYKEKMQHANDNFKIRPYTSGKSKREVQKGIASSKSLVLKDNMDYDY